MSGLTTQLLACSLTLKVHVRADQLWDLTGLASGGTRRVGADASTSPRCWDLSSGNKKWIIQVPILASIVVSRAGWGPGTDQSWQRTSQSLPPLQAQNAKARGASYSPFQLCWENTGSTGDGVAEQLTESEWEPLS